MNGTKYISKLFFLSQCATICLRLFFLGGKEFTYRRVLLLGIAMYQSTKYVNSWMYLNCWTQLSFCSQPCYLDHPFELLPFINRKHIWGKCRERYRNLMRHLLTSVTCQPVVCFKFSASLQRSKFNVTRALINVMLI